MSKNETNNLNMCIVDAITLLANQISNLQRSIKYGGDAQDLSGDINDVILKLHELVNNQSTENNHENNNIEINKCDPSGDIFEQIINNDTNSLLDQKNKYIKSLIQKAKNMEKQKFINIDKPINGNKYMSLNEFTKIKKVLDKLSLDDEYELIKYFSEKIVGTYIGTATEILENEGFTLHLMEGLTFGLWQASPDGPRVIRQYPNPASYDPLLVGVVANDKDVITEIIAIGLDENASIHKNITNRINNKTEYKFDDEAW